MKKTGKIALVMVTALSLVNCGTDVARDTSSHSLQTPLLGGAGVGFPHYSPIKEDFTALAKKYNFAELEKEYKSFSTKALADTYVKKMFNKFLIVTPNSVQVIRQVEFSRYLKNNGDTSYETSLKNIFTDTPVLYSSLTGMPAVQSKMTSESGTFGFYVLGVSPNQTVPDALPATNITSTSFTANWSAVTGATSYTLILDGVEITGITGTSRLVTGLQPGSSHTYKVKVNILGVIGNESPQISLTLLLNAPLALGATDITETSFTANWNSVDGATGYKLYINDVLEYTGSNLFYSKTGLTRGTLYNYYVKTINGAGNSANSNTISLYTIFDEFKVNFYTSYNQEYPTVATADNGSFVVTWQSPSQDVNNWDISAQKYNANGTPNGSEFLVNTSTTNNQQYPSIAMAGDGKFIIAWQSIGQDGDGTYKNIYAQRYNADGSVNGPEFLVNAYTTNDQTAPSVAMTDDGKVIISWEGQGQGDSYGVFAKIYNADGSVNGSEFLVNTYTTEIQQDPSVAMIDDGRFIISWHSFGQDGDSITLTNVYAQRYNADGTKAGSEFRVNTFTSNYQKFSSVAMASDGSFVIDWSSKNQDDDGAYYNIYGQRFNTDGTKAGSEFRVNTYTTGSQLFSSVAIADDGRFVITWLSGGQDGDGTNSNIYAQKYNAEGSLNGPEFRVNTYTTNTQQYSSIATTDNGKSVIIWHGEGLGDTYGIFGKRFDNNGNIL